MAISATSMEQEILTMIVVGQRLYKAGFGPPPSFRDMRRWSGLKSGGAICRHVNALVKKGYIRLTGESCHIEVLP